MALVCKTETVHSVDYNDLEIFIREETGREDFEILSDLECSNDTALRYSITGEISEYDLQDFIAFRAGKPKQYMTRRIMECLCANGKLSSGTYVINISW